MMRKASSLRVSEAWDCRDHMNSFASMEKLFFTKDDGKPRWHGIVWLKVTERAATLKNKPKL